MVRVVPPSDFLPVAIGFFGLGTAYFTWGGQALFQVPLCSPESDRALGLQGLWMGGFMQFISGVYLMVGYLAPIYGLRGSLVWFTMAAQYAIQRGS